jgi:hypothetical protein
MATDAREVFTEIDAEGIEADILQLPLNDEESINVERQNLSGNTLEDVEARDQSLAESTLLDARDEEVAQVSDGESVDVGGRRLLVDSERVGYAVIWQDLTLDEDGQVRKQVGYIVTDPTAIR